MKILISFMAVCLTASSAFAQSAPTMNQESHHERLTYIRNMRVFQLTLKPGESTGDYLQDYDGVTIPLTEGTIRTRRAGQDWTAAQSRPQGAASMVQYTGSPVTHRIENTGASPFRAIVVENLKDRGWSNPPALSAPGTSVQAQGRAFAVYDMRLNAGTPQTNHVHQNPSFIVLISGAVQVQGGGGESQFRLEQPGRWFPSSGPEQPHTIAVVGSGNAHVICVETK